MSVACVVSFWSSLPVFYKHVTPKGWCCFFQVEKKCTFSIFELYIKGQVIACRLIGRWHGPCVDPPTAVLMMMLGGSIIRVGQAFCAPRLLQPSVLEHAACRFDGWAAGRWVFFSCALYVHDCIQSDTKTPQVSLSPCWSFIRTMWNSPCGVSFF